jgi:hypothetical protein
MNTPLKLVFRSGLFFIVLAVALAGRVWAVPPTCPHNSQLSQDGTHCVHQQIPKCPEGQWDGYGCKVTTTSSASCPAGMTYSTATKKCEGSVDPSCPQGAQYMASSNQCVDFSSPHCPSGTRLDPDLDKCVAVQPPSCQTGTYDAAGNKCVARTQAECPAGYAYEASKKKCKTAQPPGCPSGAEWNSKDGVCISRATSSYPPVCPSGWSQTTISLMGMSVPTCTKTTTPTCPKGYTLQNGQCLKTTPTGTAV